MSESVSRVTSYACQRGIVRASALIPLAFVVISALVLSHPHTQLSSFLKNRITHNQIRAIGVAGLVTTVATLYFAHTFKDIPLREKETPFEFSTESPTSKDTFFEKKERVSGSLPPEMNAHILHFLYIDDLGRLARVSKTCQAVVQQEWVRRAKILGFKGKEHESSAFLKEKILDARYMTKQRLVPVIWRSFFRVDREASLRLFGPYYGPKIQERLKWETKIGNVPAIQTLARYGADTSNIWKELIYYHDDPELCEKLYPLAGVSFHSRSWSSAVSALQAAVYFERERSIDYFLKIEEQRDFFGAAGGALHVASSRMVPKLLEAGVDPNLVDLNGQTAIFKHLNDPKAVELLLPHVDVNFQTANSGKTALTESVRWHFKTARLLLEAGADVNLVTQSGQTALHLACYEPVLVVMMLAQGAIQIPDQDGRTPLRYAVGSYAWKAAEFLLDAGGNSNIVETIWPMRSCLADAVFRGAPFALFKRLLDATVIIDHQDAVGQTALHHAVIKRKKSEIRALLEKGADQTLKDRFGKTAYDYATPFIRPLFNSPKK